MLFAGILSELCLVVLLVGGLVVTAAVVSGRNLTEELFNPAGGAASVVDLESSDSDVIPIYHLILSHDEQSAIVCNQKREVIVHSLGRGDSQRTVCSTLAGTPSCITCLPNDSRFIVGHVEGDIEIRDDVTSSNSRGSQVIPGAHDGMVLCLEVSPDGTLLASGSNDGQVHLWSIDGGQRERSFDVPAGIVQSLRFTPDNRRFAAACSDNTVRLWDVESSEEIQRFGGHSGAIMDFEFLENGGRLATCSLDRTLRLWNARTGAEEWRSPEIAAPLFALSASPDGRSLACGDLQGVLRIFNLDLTEFLVETDAHPMGVRCLCYSRNGETLLSAGYDGIVCEWTARTMRVSRRLQ